MSTNVLWTLGGERYLNKVNYQYVMSSDVAQQYPGLLGAEHTYIQDEAEALTDTSVTGYSSSTKLGPGTYKIVKFHTTLTITPARGVATYWKAGEDPDSFIVTTDAPTGGTQFAGLCINVVTAGYYGIIQISGVGHALGKASSLTNTGAVGQRLSIVSATGAWDNPDNGALTDSGTGTATTATIAAGTGQYVLPIHCTLAQITGAGDILTNHVLGHKFKILSVDAVVDKVVTTAAKLFTANLEIGTTNVTGGEVALTSANCTPLGARVAGAAITAANTGSASDTISIEAASVTAFAEGEVIFLIRIQNMDTADAFSALVAATNARRSSNVIALEAPAFGALKKVYINGGVPNPVTGHY